MSISYFDVKCEVKQSEDGTCVVIISVSGVSHDDAIKIVEATRQPFREAIIEALGATEIARIDKLKPLQ